MATQMTDDDTVDIVPFESWHLGLLQQQSFSGLSSPLTHGTALKAAGPCYSAFAGMSVIACAGIVEFWKGRSQLWALTADALPLYEEALYRAVVTFLEGYQVRRLECVVDPRAHAAREWAERLGFVEEGVMSRYTIDGDDALMLIRIQPIQPNN